MNHIYEGPVNVRRASTNSYNGDERLQFADGQEVQISRDMWDSCAGSVAWPSGSDAGATREQIIAANQQAGRALHDKPGGQLVFVEPALTASMVHNRIVSYELRQTQQDVGQAAVNVVLGNRFASDAAALKSMAATASPTVAARHQQVFEILSSR